MLLALSYKNVQKLSHPLLNRTIRGHMFESNLMLYLSKCSWNFNNAPKNETNKLYVKCLTFYLIAILVRQYQLFI